MEDTRELLLASTLAPRWVEARSCLLEGRDAGEATVDDGHGTLFVVRPPARDVLVASVREAESVIVAPEHEAIVAAVVPHLTRKKILVHTLPSLASLPPCGALVAWIGERAVREAAIPSDLRDELLAALDEDREIAAAWVNGEPASFCYAGAITESLWDVSIDTVEAHRGRGLAAACACHVIRHFHARGKRPVWQSLADNPPSFRLAKKLGFVVVDELVVFEGASPS